MDFLTTPNHLRTPAVPDKSGIRRVLDELASSSWLYGMTAGAAYLAGTSGTLALAAPAVLYVPLALLHANTPDRLEHPRVQAASKPSDPSLLTRLSRFLSHDTAKAVVTRAQADVEQGIWKPGSKNAVYGIHNGHIDALTTPQAIAGYGRSRGAVGFAPLPQDRHVHQVSQEIDGYEALVINIGLDGRDTFRTCRDGLLASHDDRPSLVQTDDLGAPTTAVWHSLGRVERTWTAEEGPLVFDMDGSIIASEIRHAIADLIGQPGSEKVVERLTRMAEDAEIAAEAGERVPVEVVGGSVDLSRLRTGLLTNVRPTASTAPGI